MVTFETKLRVRYAETDQMGYVYYGNYAAYYEVARVEMLRSLGTSYKDMEDRGIMLPVTELTTRYHRPILYDEEIMVRVKITDMPSVRIRFEYEVFNEQGQLANTGETTLVFVDKDKQRPRKAPDSFLESLAPYF